MANIEDVSTLGVKVGIALETSAGVRPTTGYTAIPRVYELPDMDFDADSIDTTTFDNLVYKSSMDGLKDTGGVLSLTANYTEDGVKLWDEQASKATNGLGNWLVIYIPKVKTQYFIPITAIATGVPTINLNDRLTIGYKFSVRADIEKDESDESTIFASATGTSLY